MKPSSVSARWVGLLVVIVLVIGILSAQPALARSGCNTGPTAGHADIALVQAVTTANSVSYVDHLTITNFGPCNVPNVGLSVTLPGNLIAFSSNPSSWSCDGVTTPNVTCWETSTIGVPGTADIYLEYSAVAGMIFACAATFSGTPPPTSCDLRDVVPPVVPVPDQNPANNQSTVAAGLLGTNDPLTYGPTFNGKPNPSSNGLDHTTTIELANGGLVNIYQTSSEKKNCPLSVPDCFIGTNTINITVNDPSIANAKTWTLTFLASLTKKALTQITVWNSVDGGLTYTALSNCSGKHPTDPCVSSRSKSTNSAGETIFTIVVSGTQDDVMTAD